MFEKYVALFANIEACLGRRTISGRPWVKHMQDCLEDMCNFPQFLMLSLSYL